MAVVAWAPGQKAPPPPGPALVSAINGQPLTSAINGQPLTSATGS